MITDKFKLVSKPKQDDLGIKTMAAYLLSGGETNKNVLRNQIQQVVLKESAILQEYAEFAERYI